MAPPRPPPPLIDDVTAEILLRLPPGEPEHLFRAALVCKPWLRILCDPAFLRRYRAFHGAPPLLGLLHTTRFTSTTSMPDFPYPGPDGRRTLPLDCRHGRVLLCVLEEEPADYIVCDPITGDRHVVPAPDIDDCTTETAVVLCAAYGCDHLHCHGGPFRVVSVAIHLYEHTISASVYSSETGVWSVPISPDSSCESYVQRLEDRPYLSYLEPRRAILIGDEIYFTVWWGNAIVKYDLGRNCLSMIDPPPPDEYIAIMEIQNNSLGFARLEGFSLCTWSRKVNSEGNVEWVQCRVMDLETMIPVRNLIDKATIVGYAEGVGVIFVRTAVGLFTVKLNSGKVKKINKDGFCYSNLPYMSFYTPDRGRLLSLARDL